MSWEAQDLLAVQKIFDIELVQTARGEEFYFIPKQGWTNETWQAGTDSFCKITEASLELYDSSIGQVYRPTETTDKIVPLIQFITKWPKEAIVEKVKEMQQIAEQASRAQRQEVEMYADGKADVLAGFVGTMVIRPWVEQNSFYVMMQNVSNTEDEMMQILSHYSNEGVQKNPTAQGTIYYPTNPQDEKFLKFVDDVSAEQQKLAESQTQLKPGQRQLRMGAAADQTPLAVNAIHRTGKSAVTASPFKTGVAPAQVQGAVHMVAGHVITKSVFDGTPVARIVRGGGLTTDDGTPVAGIVHGGRLTTDDGHAGGR